MPIRPENRALYPRDWKAISLYVREVRARNRCECHGECARDSGKRACVYDDDGRCLAVNTYPNPRTGSKVVLTVAHLNDDPSTADPDLLLALCQSCHLSLDRELHKRNAAATRAAAKPTLF